MIKLTQWLCPDRHCLLALLHEETEKEESVVEAGEATFTNKGGAINRWCGICGSPQVEPETATTRFRTMDEAMGPMRETERKNAEARDILGGRF